MEGEVILLHWEITLPNLAIIVALIVAVGIFACGLGWCVLSAIFAISDWIKKMWRK